MTLKEKLLNHFYELQNYYKNGIASEGEPEIIENLENDLKFVVDIIREIKSTQIGKANQVERMVMPTLKEITEKREYKTCYLLIATLANMCAGNEDKIIDLLTGYLWDKEEARILKSSA